MADQLSGVAVIICIALGVMTVVLLFIFGKRQIMRFTLKSRRGPHAIVGHDAPKLLREEIDRRLDCIHEMHHEPPVLKLQPESTSNGHVKLTTTSYNHFYRMKAVDSLPILDQAVASRDCNKVRRKGQDVRIFLLKLAHGGMLTGCDTKIVHEFADLYERARHEPLDFTSDHLSRYLELMNYLRIWITSGKPN